MYLKGKIKGICKDCGKTIIDSTHGNRPRSFCDKTCQMRYRNRIDNPMKSKEVRDKMADSKRGIPSWNKGIPLSEEHKEHLRGARPHMCKPRPEMCGRTPWNKGETKYTDPRIMEYSNKQKGVPKENVGKFKIGHPSITKFEDTAPERMINTELLKRTKLNFERNYQMVGTPDFAFVDARVAVFVDGCYWHGCPECFSNRLSEDIILKRNRTDHNVNVALLKEGWKIMRFWEHDIYKDPGKCADLIITAVENASL
jgi:DNA mismatch endonuclease (patch repair protein)